MTKGEWQWDTLNIRDETGAFVVGNCCSIEREMELIVNAHNEALRAAVEEERERCCAVAKDLQCGHVVDAIRRRAQEPGGGA